MSKLNYRVVLSRDDEKNWLVSVPAIPGYRTFGRSRSEALANAREAIEACLENLACTGDSQPIFDVSTEGPDK